jgi:hypothetical protein
MNLQVLKDHKQTLKEYLLVKLDQEDWHGIRDVCVDIELIEKEIEMLHRINK